jgi:hypothetical protein
MQAAFDQIAAGQCIPVDGCQLADAGSYAPLRRGLDERL